MLHIARISCRVILEASVIIFFFVAASCHRGYAANAINFESGDMHGGIYSNSPLKLSVRGVKKIYKKTDKIKMRLILKNESASNIYVLGSVGWTSSVKIFLKDESTGVDASSSFVPLLIPPPPRSASDFLKIPSEGYIESEVELPLGNYELQSGHKYEIVAQYEGAVPKKMGFGLNLYSSEMPPIAADPVSIEIVSN